MHVSACLHSHSRISWSIVAKSGTQVTTPKSKNEFMGGHQHHITPYPILPPQNPNFGGVNRHFQA